MQDGVRVTHDFHMVDDGDSSSSPAIVVVEHNHVNQKKAQLFVLLSVWDVPDGGLKQVRILTSLPEVYFRMKFVIEIIGGLLMEQRKLYTSYYANGRKIPIEINRVAISIALPGFMTHCSHEPLLAPSSQLLEGYKGKTISEEEYIVIYTAYLESEKEHIRARLKEYAEGNADVVFMCYEKATSFCHRHLFRKFANEELGFSIEEYGYPELTAE